MHSPAAVGSAAAGLKPARRKAAPSPASARLHHYMDGTMLGGEDSGLCRVATTGWIAAA